MASFPAWTAPVYEVNGFHVGMSFDQAVALAEDLGGVCEREVLRHGAMVTANCLFPTCVDGDGQGECRDASTPAPALELGGQAIVRIGLKSGEVSATLSKIAIAFDGDTDKVARRMVEKYGAPFSDTTDFEGKTWSHARRMHWRSGREGVGLLRSITRLP